MTLFRMVIGKSLTKFPDTKIDDPSSKKVQSPEQI